MSIFDLLVPFVPDLFGASITIVRADHSWSTLLASSSIITDLDHVQYELHSGPCVTASTTGTIAYAQDEEMARRWPSFAVAVESQGIGSVLSLPLGDPVRGALNIYGQHADTFDAPTTWRLLAVAEVLAQLLQKEDYEDTGIR